MDSYPPPASITLSPQSPNPAPPNSNVNTKSSIFRPRRSDDWHEYREIIEQLYRNDQLKLRDVKRIMERDYKFQASRPEPISADLKLTMPREKQYKDRLAAWHVRKNIKAKEVHLMIRKQQKRAARGKQTAFRVNGQEVDNKRIARFQRRYGDTWDEEKDKDIQQMSPEPATPSDMSCYTPEPADEGATPVSPPEIQSPSRETPYPLSYDDDSPFPMSMHHNPSRRTYHHPPTEPLVHPVHPQSQHQHQHHHPHVQHPHAHHPHPHHPQPHLPHPHAHAHLPHPQHIMSTTAGSVGPVQSLPPGVPILAPMSASSHREYLAQTGMVPSSTNSVPHNNDWGALDNFQTHLEMLNTKLNESMSKWNRDQDPNEHLNQPHPEGTGL